jgi:hypothetical protein
MPTAKYYERQAQLFFSMALACADPERRAQLEARGRTFLNLAGHPGDQSPDLNVLLEGFNAGQMRRPRT